MLLSASLALGLVAVGAVVMILVRRRRAGPVEKCPMLASAVVHAADLVIITNADGVIEFVNPAFERRTGFSREEVLGATPRVLKSGIHDRGFYARLWEDIRRGEIYRGTFVNRTKSGELFWLEQVIAPIRDARGRISHFVATGRDITQSRRLEERLDRLTYYDPLTKAGNRALLDARLRACARTSVGAALAVLDVDRFSTLTGALGRSGSEEVLIQVVERLRAIVRSGDEVCRVGEDRFAMMLNGADDSAARQVVRRAIQDLGTPFVILGKRVQIAVAAGIAVQPRDGVEPEDVLKCAETALRAAREGRVTCLAYDPEMERPARERVTIESGLSLAIARGALVHHFQDVQHIASGVAAGVEALVRWPNAPLAPLGPDRFIPVAEDSGQIVELDRHTISAVLERVGMWSRQGWLGWAAVNVSGRTLGDPWLVAHVDDALERSGIDAERVVIEVTESALTDAAAALPVVRDLHSLGVRIAVDDFGTGYSSLAALHEYAIDLLKVDKRFVAGLGRQRASDALVRGVIAMARALDARVIAEGIETREQLEWLRDAGCDYGQGFLLGRPMPSAEFERRFVEAPA